MTFSSAVAARGMGICPENNPSLAALTAKLTPEVRIIQELFRDPLGLLELFGRKSSLDIGDNPRWLVDEYAWLGLFPVSIKEYYYDAFFRDADHLAAYLSQRREISSC